VKLYLVPTPIGNLEDITLRAVNVLKSADVILAEDTRTSGVLMKHLGISKPLQSYHIFNEHQTAQRVVEQLKQGKTYALVSDAGTPAISDPGFLLVRECIRQNVCRGQPLLCPLWLTPACPPTALRSRVFCPTKKADKHA
jgi:16S rRNA (cytidine1402-2'-O)-methyltransferase